MKRLSVAATLVALTSLLLLALAAPAWAVAPTPAPVSSGVPAAPLTLRVGIAEDVDGMNPFSAWSGPTWESFRLNYDFLTWYDKDYNPAPDLATSWDHTADGKVWTFHLVHDATWQDGQPLTADDVVFTYNLILDNQLSAYTSYLPFVTKVEAPDPYTVRITNSKPASGMLALYIPILPQHIWSKVPKDKLETYPNVPMIGSGPFEVTESKKSHYVKLVANKKYFGGAPTIDQIYFEIYKSPDSAVQDFKAGNLDAVSLTGSSYYRSMQNIPGTEAKPYQTIGFYELGFNCWQSPKSKADPAMRDPAFRQAVHWAIDKQKLVDVAMSGYPQVGTSIISPLSPYHWEPPADQLVTYNPDKAKQILDTAGYKDVNGDGWRESPAGKTMRIRLTPLTDYPEEVTSAKLIFEWLKNVGINVKLDPMEEATFNDVYWGGDFDMYLWWWGGDIDPGFMLSCFTTAQIHGWSDCYYSNPEYDAMYLQQAATVDIAQRKAIVDRMQQLLYDQDPYIVLWYNVDTQAFRTDKWTGWSFAPPGKGGVIRNFMRTSYIDLKLRQGGVPKKAGSKLGLIVGIVIAVAVVAAVIVVVVVRRKPKVIEE